MGLALRIPKALSFYVWIYCLLSWFIQDAAKVGTYWLLRRFNVFGINDDHATTEASAAAHPAKSPMAEAARAANAV
jgi:H+-transporting ATPase